VPRNHYRTALIGLNNLEARLGSEIPRSDFHGFSPKATAFFCVDRDRTFRVGFDLRTGLTGDFFCFSHSSALTRISNAHPMAILDSGDLVLYSGITGKPQIWKLDGNIDDLSDQDAAAVRGLSSKHVRVGWFRELHPIVFASHSLTTQSLADLANCSPVDKDAVRARLPDDQTKTLFDGFHAWRLANK
jgi:hypothetical protein